MLSAALTGLPQQCTLLPNLNLSPFAIHHNQEFNGKHPYNVYFKFPSKKDISKSINFYVICSSSGRGLSSSDQNLPPEEKEQEQRNMGFWEKWKANSAEMSAKLAKLGLAAVLAYGLFDGVTYTTFFVMSFLGYEKSTGNNPAANLKALIGIVLVMWAGNNVTRPFRVAGAAALAPVIDKALRKIQKALKFPSLVYAFALVVGIVATCCFTILPVVIPSFLISCNFKQAKQALAVNEYCSTTLEK